MLDRKGRLTMDEPKKRLLNSLRTEAGVFSEVYISSPVGEGVARNILDPATHLLFSNKLEDNAPIDELRAQGLSIDEAISELLRPPGAHGMKPNTALAGQGLSPCFVVAPPCGLRPLVAAARAGHRRGRCGRGVPRQGSRVHPDPHQGQFRGRPREGARSWPAAFAQRLPLALEELPRECNCLVVLKSAVAGPTPNTVDLTAQLRRKVEAP
jgi:hypothetical protein